MQTTNSPVSRMTDEQRRGRRDLIALIVLLVAMTLLGTVRIMWDAGVSWRSLYLGIGPLIAVVAGTVRLWRGDRATRWACVCALACVGAILILVGAVRWQEMFYAEAFEVYGRIRFHPLAAMFGSAAACLFSAGGLAYSSPIGAFMDFQRAERNRVQSFSQGQGPEKSPDEMC